MSYKARCAEFEDARENTYGIDGHGIHGIHVCNICSHIRDVQCKEVACIGAARFLQS